MGVDLGTKEVGGELGEEIVIRIYCMREESMYKDDDNNDVVVDEEDDDDREGGGGGKGVHHGPPGQLPSC